VEENKDTRKVDRIKPELIIDSKINEKQQNTFNRINQEAKPMPLNSIDIVGVDFKKTNEGLEVTGLIRHTLAKKVAFEEVEVRMFDKDGSIIAETLVDFSKTNPILPNTSVPRTIVFQVKDLWTKEIPEVGWGLELNLRINSSHILDLEASWPEKLTERDKIEWKRYIKKLPNLKDNEVNFHKIKAAMNVNNKLELTLLIRNGRNNSIFFKNLVISVSDANGELIAESPFDIKQIEFKPNTSKPWTFTFPKTLLESELDLSDFHVNVRNNI
jgi:accessory Sec system S-layer assembly protein